MAIRQSVNFSQVGEELMSKFGALGIEVTLDEEDNKIFNPKDEEDSEEKQDSENENGDDK